ncbi:response regulator [Bradyrhizobium jicamae]|uniref:response regulator n=1 Tax=Bradyrhizobium jicamae TaxID=280332 RepID=UPI001BA9983C|nr:response regulator [Bradyrhizobium jicamae]MBR0754690.1 response regulator [Bradyrhizobium jicamae]
MQDRPIILVIEDDRQLQSIVEDALTDGGYEPAIAGSGEEALTLLKAFTTKYRALVVDIRLLGRLDGWRVARGAREIDASFPVIYITGGGGDEWPTKGVPGSILLQKPFSPDELVAAVTRAVAAKA